MRTVHRHQLLGWFALLASACASQPPLRSGMPAAGGEPRVAYAVRMLELVEGRGSAAEPGTCLYVHYTGWFTDGRKFDSSHDTLPSGAPRTPLAFAYGAGMVRPGWDAGGLDGMLVGGKRRLFLPYQLGYGTRGRPPVIPPMADMIFDVELMAVADTLPRADSPPPRTRGEFAPRCADWSAVPHDR